MDVNAKTPLSTMLGGGDFFQAQGKKYVVNPLKLKEIDEFTKDNMIIGEAQFFNMSNKENRRTLDKWFQKKVVTENGLPLTVEMAMNDEWDLDDLKSCISTLIRISG